MKFTEPVTIIVQPTDAVAAHLDYRGDVTVSLTDDLNVLMEHGDAERLMYQLGCALRE